jgi:hypothetical protein
MAEPLDLFLQSISISHTVKPHLAKFENGRIGDAKSVLRTKSFFCRTLKVHLESTCYRVYQNLRIISSGFLEAFGAKVKSGLSLQSKYHAFPN